MKEITNSPKKNTKDNIEISIVIPLYNEQDNILKLHKEIHTSMNKFNYELILVDDGSTDKTIKKIDTNIIKKGNKQTKLLKFKKNTGQSAAMYAGIMNSKGKYIVMLDGDLQNDPNDIPLLIKTLKEKNTPNNKKIDLVCGYRKNRQDTTSKKIQSKIANYIRSRFTGDGVRDTGCSLKAMRAECKKYLIPFNGLHRFIPAFIASHGGTIKEIPVNHRARKYGESKYGFKNRALKATIDMLGVKWLTSRNINYEIETK